MLSFLSIEGFTACFYKLQALGVIFGSLLSGTL